MDIISGSVVRAYGRFYWVKVKNLTLQCAVRENIKTRADAVLSPVVVGDYVDLKLLIDISNPDLTLGQKPHGVIINVHQRRTKFSRPKRGKEELEQIVAANIDRMMIVTSVARPQFKIGLIDRFLLAAHNGGLDPVIVINKIDLEHKLDIERLKSIYSSINVPVITTSATRKIGLRNFIKYLTDKQSIILGQSGVGKSSLLNAIEEGLKLRVGKVSDASNKGIHTTTAVEMHALSFGGYVVDTPGLKYLGLWNIEADDLKYLFPEIERLSNKCRFRNCMHRAEPGCAVKKAVMDEVIYPERYNSYKKIIEQL